jgi:signal transduction histidine kinase
MYLLDFSYKGLFLLLIAEAFLNVQMMPLKVVWLALAFVCYIVFDYDLLTVTTLRTVPLQSYINFYPQSYRIFLYGIKTSLDSINLILVIIFFYQLIQGKIYENKEFIKVNTELQNNIRILQNMTEEVKEAERVKERNRLAHEIHDILGHSLTCIDTGLEACIVLAQSTNQELSNQLKKIRGFAHTGLLDIRASVHELETDTRVDQPLNVTIASLVSNINEAKIGHASLLLEGDIPELEADERQTVYRLVQESITNAITHGKAQNIVVSLKCDNTHIEVAVSDDGVGPASIHKNFGLRHMEEQVDLLGGEISFRSEVGRGFAVHAILPIRRSSI